MFEATGQCYGRRRLRKALAEQGIEIGRHRVRSLMKELRRKPTWKPKFVHTTDTNQNLPVYENVLDRQFEQVEANRAWVSDITYIRTLSGWLLVPLGISGGGAGLVFAQNRRLGHGAQHTGGAGLLTFPHSMDFYYRH
ncbi:IS3 family transposase [Methylomonas albis]|uniref:IS3 family transposase n=1 Tax=Methylomonas albis TaxID=1854563 RepID=A0ABR9D3X6_9GAMM|nr:IS3 family transposase [Methylomonas albis]MBD9357822.1 IS3 family transposase [Methylomonas albis]